MAKVDFFICGVQKGGTTALDAMLRRHPSIRMAARKEVHFFDDENNVDWSIPSYASLHAQFDWNVDAVRGEATPIYTYWPNSLERLHAYNPDAKLIIALRHPIHRAYSHWKMETTRGSETLSFSEAISAEGRKRVSASPLGVHRVFSYIERGFYARQLKRVFRLFPRDCVHLFRTDDLWKHPSYTLRGIQRFLGVKSDEPTSASPEYIVPLVSNVVDVPSPADVAMLRSLYNEEIQKLAEDTGLLLVDWLDEAYEEPMLGHAT